MSGSQAKALRRDLRRAVGEEAIATIDAQTQAVNHRIIPNLNALQQHVDGVIEEIKALRRRLTDAEGKVHHLQIVRRRSFWGRLGWLVTGH